MNVGLRPYWSEKTNGVFYEGVTSNANGFSIVSGSIDWLCHHTALEEATQRERSVQTRQYSPSSHDYDGHTESVIVDVEKASGTLF